MTWPVFLAMWECCCELSVVLSKLSILHVFSVPVLLRVTRRRRERCLRYRTSYRLLVHSNICAWRIHFISFTVQANGWGLLVGRNTHWRGI